MKANVPEKIYSTTFYLDDDKGDTKWKKTPVAGAENVEYVRTDAFVEKACEFWRDHLAGYDICEDDIERSVESFKLAMKL